MLRNKLRIIVFTLISIFTFAENVELKHGVDENGYEYTYTDGIYSDSREYTLNNGLKVYLTKKDNTPNIYSEIVVRAGSKNDPEKTTGLAHYFEHLMFKGSDEIGTIDWNKEKPILDQIEQLYEDHKKETDPEKKKEIYKKIDDLSYEASKYSISNEYSQLVSSIGGTGLNAFTSYDSTVFTMNFPSKNIEKAMEFIEQKSREAGVKRVELGCFEMNERAFELYKKIGFVEIGRIDNMTEYNGKWWQDIRMEKDFE